MHPSVTTLVVATFAFSSISHAFVYTEFVTITGTSWGDTNPTSTQQWTWATQVFGVGTPVDFECYGTDYGVDSDVMPAAFIPLSSHCEDSGYRAFINGTMWHDPKVPATFDYSRKYSPGSRPGPFQQPHPGHPDQDTEPYSYDPTIVSLNRTGAGWDSGGNPFTSIQDLHCTRPLKKSEAIVFFRHQNFDCRQWDGVSYDGFVGRVDYTNFTKYPDGSDNKNHCVNIEANCAQTIPSDDTRWIDWLKAHQPPTKRAPDVSMAEAPATLSTAVVAG